ncbi:MAG: YggT family protein [Corynebacterium sp.]|uniref:YggT family protein n=1 Tax=uncultured Corynebacterium sp. TaxID=159447 RepID=UPI0017FFFAEB|nr:YggT family protein [uncultured Corynebacterium sp.]NLZ57161.1 YggT family protein [Corynebacterium sp.]
MGNIALLIAWIIDIYMFVLIARIVIEMIQSFSRSFSPPKWFYIIAEPIFAVTDPPVKLLRRIIPTMPLGNIRLDISVIVLFFILSILRALVTLLPF